MEAELKRRRPPRVQQAPSPTGPLEELNRLCDLVTRGDYFECLGLSREVGTSGVREAWIRTSAELMDLRVRTAGFEGAAASIDMSSVFVPMRSRYCPTRIFAWPTSGPAIDSEVRPMQTRAMELTWPF